MCAYINMEKKKNKGVSSETTEAGSHVLNDVIVSRPHLHGLRII